MHRLSLIAIQRPWLTLVLGIFAVAAIAPGLARLEIRTDGHALVPEDAPEIQFDRRVRDEFAIEDPIVVLIEPDNEHGVFNDHTIRLVTELTDAFLELDGVRPVDVISLATEHGHRVRTGTLNFRRLLEPLPQTRTELDRLRDDLRGIKLYTGTIVSYDENATAIMVGVPSGHDRVQAYQDIADIIAERQPLPEKISIIGAPVAEALLGTHLLEDLGVPQALLGRFASRDEAPVDGFPRSLHELRLWLGHHIGLVPVAILVLALVFALAFRGLRPVALPLMEVGAALVFVFSLMGWFGVPIYLTIAVLPVILTAVGVADEIHIFSHYRQLRHDMPDAPRREIVERTMHDMAAPIVKTSVTTAIGFLSFALSPIGAVQAFGIFTAAGVLFCMCWSLTVIPAQLVLGRRQATAAPQVTIASMIRRRPLWNGIAGLATRGRLPLLLLTLGLVTVAGFGIRRVVIQDSWINGFARESEFRRATNRFNEGFLGTHLLMLLVDTHNETHAGMLDLDFVDHHFVSLPASEVPPPETIVGRKMRFTMMQGGRPVRAGQRADRFHAIFETWISEARLEGDRVIVTWPRTHGSPKISVAQYGADAVQFEVIRLGFVQPEIIGKVADLTAFARAQKDCAVGGALGTADYIETTNLMKGGLKEERRVVPGDPRQVEHLWGDYKRIRGEGRLRQIVDSEFARAPLTIYLTDANFRDTARLMERLRDFEESHLIPHGVSFEFAGDVAVSQTLIQAIVQTQVRSLIWSMVGILVITTILNRSLRYGLLSVVPCALAVTGNFAVMGYTGMPLGVATSMFAGMTLGIGVDFAIHLLERHRRARAQGVSARAAIAQALQGTGPAILIDGVAVALGFSVMMLSQVPANARLGALVVLSIAGCLLATLIVLPAMLALGGGKAKLPAREIPAPAPTTQDNEIAAPTEV